MFIVQYIGYLFPALQWFVLLAAHDDNANHRHGHDDDHDDDDEDDHDHDHDDGGCEDR